ncbi:hypothetical protein PCK1_002580 [Pneumocystis canis]|nr:hypothetical protein PCK1_002580 [Pneumocystis canis]
MTVKPQKIFDVSFFSRMRNGREQRTVLVGLGLDWKQPMDAQRYLYSQIMEMGAYTAHRAQDGVHTSWDEAHTGGIQ